LTHQLEQSYWWYVARRKIILSFVTELLESSDHEAGARPRLLDYGCGTGINLVYFARLAEVYGVDVSVQAIDLCRQRGIKHVSLIEPDQPLDAFGQFDLITMLDVLEHLADDRQALRQMMPLLKPGAGLLVTVPAYEFLWSGEDYVSGHQRRYTRRSLAETFHSSGYSVVKLTYFNTLLFPLQVVTILWRRLFQPRSMYTTNLAPMPRRLNSLLTSGMSSEARFLRRVNFPFGGSLLGYGQIR
jgi:SAM-dependent methyltransferase